MEDLREQKEMIWMSKAFKKPVKKDWYLDKGPRGMSKNRGFKTCYVVKHGGATESIPHPEFPNDVYTIQPYSLCNVPLMVAQELDDMEEYDILPKAVGDKFIDQARSIIIKNNQEAYDYNVENSDKKGWKPKKLKSLYIKKYDRNVSPYTCYLDALAKSKSKKEKGKKKKE